MPGLLDYLRPQPQNPFGPFNSRVTYYAPGPGDRMEGGFETSRPNPQTGKSVPSTLDNYRLGYSPFVTLAGDPSRYGQAVKMGPLTYTSPIDQKSYTLPDVTGVVHDTGSAFKGRPDKLDVAAGDYRGYSPQAASAAVQADGGRRTVTPTAMPQRPSGMDMEFDPWTGQAPKGGAVDNPPGGETAVALGPPPQQGQKKMPNSLLDMFQPQDAAGQPVGFGDAVTGRSNSLIGLGLGLLSPSNPLRGQSGWSQAMEGYMSGAGLDARQATAKASLAHQKTQDARQAMMDKFNMGMQERQFARSGEGDFAKVAREIGLTPGTPEYAAGAQKYYQGKTEGDWSIAEVPHPLYPDQKVPVWANKRTRETIPFTSGSSPPGTTAVGGGPDAPLAGGGVSYGAAGLGNQGFGTGGVAPAYPAATPGATGPSGAAPTVPGRAWAPPPAGSNLAEYNKEKTKEYVKQQAEAEQKAKRAGRIDPVSEDIDRAINAVEASPGLTTGFGGQMMRHIGGSKAGDVEGLINTIKANSSLDKLQELKSQSQTGASGLGAISDKEQSMLQAAIGELDQSRSSEQLKYNLDRVKRIRHEIIHGEKLPARYEPPSEQRAPSARQTGGGNAAPRPGFVKGGYVFKGGDPSDQTNWAPVK